VSELKILFVLLSVSLVACCGHAKAELPVAAQYGIYLAPGEVLVAVNGISVMDHRPLVLNAPVRRIANAVVVQPIRAARQCFRDARGVMRCDQ